MTNEEKIKNMSTEELASFFANIIYGYSIYKAFGAYPSIAEMQEWLKEDVEE